MPPSLLEFLGEQAPVFLITNNRVERSCNNQLPNMAELLKPLTFYSLIAVTDQGQVGLLLPHRCQNQESCEKETFLPVFSMTINHTRRPRLTRVSSRALSPVLPVSPSTGWCCEMCCLSLLPSVGQPRQVEYLFFSCQWNV